MTFKEKRDVSINILLCFYLIQIVGISDISWLKKDSSYFGLWSHCDKSAEYDCCQGSHTVGLNNKAWLEASRALIIIGALGGFAIIITSHFIEENSTEIMITAASFSIVTAVIIFIGTGVFLEHYKKEVLLHQYDPHACIALSFINGFVYLIFGIGLFKFSIKGYKRIVSPNNTTQNVPVQPFRGLNQQANSQAQPIRGLNQQAGRPGRARRINVRPPCPRYWQSYRIGKYVTRFDRYDVDDRTMNAIKKLVQDAWSATNAGIGRDARNLNHNAITVRKVERIENVNLFIQYNTKRRFMEKSDRPFMRPSSSDQILTMAHIDHLMLSDINTSINECYLFHGTKSAVHENIMSKGLDPRHSSDGSMFGSGVYTAESPSKADQYTDDTNNRRSTDLKMFLVRVLLGNMHVTNTAKKFKKPPCMDCQAEFCAESNHDNYDSVVAESSSLRFREFIVYDKYQCYPEYLITYDRE